MLLTHKRINKLSTCSKNNPKININKSEIKAKSRNNINIVNELDKNPLITITLQHRKIPASFLRQS